MKWRLLVQYPGRIDQEFDDALERHLGISRLWSGCGFGVRDIEFEYPDKRACMNAARELRERLTRSAEGAIVQIDAYPSRP